MPPIYIFLKWIPQIINSLLHTNLTCCLHRILIPRESHLSCSLGLLCTNSKIVFSVVFIILNSLKKRKTSSPHCTSPYNSHLLFFQVKLTNNQLVWKQKKKEANDLNWDHIKSIYLTWVNSTPLHCWVALCENMACLTYLIYFCLITTYGLPLIEFHIFVVITGYFMIAKKIICVSLSIILCLAAKQYFLSNLCDFIILFIYFARNILVNVSNTMTNNSEDNGHCFKGKRKFLVFYYFLLIKLLVSSNICRLCIYSGIYMYSYTYIWYII